MVRNKFSNLFCHFNLAVNIQHKTNNCPDILVEKPTTKRPDYMAHILFPMEDLQEVHLLQNKVQKDGGGGRKGCEICKRIYTLQHKCTLKQGLRFATRTKFAFR